MHFLCVPQGKYNFRVERRKGKKRGRRKKQRGKMGGGERGKEMVIYVDVSLKT